MVFPAQQEQKWAERLNCSVREGEQEQEGECLLIAELAVGMNQIQELLATMQQYNEVHSPHELSIATSQTDTEYL